MPFYSQVKIIRIFNAFNHPKAGRIRNGIILPNKKGRIRNDNILPHTKEENIIGRKEKGVSSDTVLKNYWSGNEEFADLFNAVLFGGSQIIRADELENEDTEDSVVLEHRKQAEGVKAARDNIKIMKKSTAYGVQLVLLGLESQEHIHYAMPLRVMGYDYATYKKQYNNNARQYKKQSAQQDARLDEHEFLSKMKKTDRLLPVVTIVIYYGEKVWDAATSLHGILDIPAEMAPYVNDYRMLLVEARQNNLYFHNGNNQDLFNLFGILLDQNKKIRDKKAGGSRHCATLKILFLPRRQKLHIIYYLVSSIFYLFNYSYSIALS